MELFKTLMSKFGAVLMALCFVTTFALAAPQEAEAGDWEVGGDFGFVTDVGGYDAHGFGFTIYGGYRFLDWVGVYLDQQLSGVWWEHSEAGSYFVGSTVVNARFFLPVGPVELWGQIGMGAGYEGEWGAFDFKLGIGAQYPITNNIAIGGKFAYQVFANDGADHILNLAVTLNYQL
jgi:hypothetical protein